MTSGYDPLEGSAKYRTTKELGRGGMGEVFLGEHLSLGSKVVIKLLHAELSDRSGLVDRMRLEAQSLASLNHPNIVRVTDFDRTPSGRPYFVMEYLPGRPLSDDVASRGGFVPPAEAINIARQALAGLTAAHQAGLVHRDMKLDNLFVAEAPGPDGTPQRVIKILDFGVAKVMDRDADDGPAPLMVPTGTGVVVGTPRFFAPEQARGQKLDHRADIYAMGLVLYSMLVGRGPFDHATNITEMAKAHVLQKPEPPSRLASQHIPPELDAIILRAVEKNPDARFQSAAEFSAELARVEQMLASGQPAATPAAHPATQFGAPSVQQQAPATPIPVSGSDAETERFQRSQHTPPPRSDMAPTAPLPAGSQPGATGAHTQAMGAPPPGMLASQGGAKRYGMGMVAAVLMLASLFGAAAAALALRLA